MIVAKGVADAGDARVGLDNDKGEDPLGAATLSVSLRAFEFGT